MICRLPDSVTPCVQQHSARAEGALADSLAKAKEHGSNNPALHSTVQVVSVSAISFWAYGLAQLAVLKEAVQFTMVFLCSEKPTCAAPRLSEVFQMSPLKQFQGRKRPFQTSVPRRRPFANRKNQIKIGGQTKQFKLRIFLLNARPIIFSIKNTLASVTTGLDCRKRRPV